MAHTRHPDELTPYHRNPRQSDLERLCESLLVHGQYRPLVINLGTHTGRPLEVLAGNHVLTAMRMLAVASPHDPRWSHLGAGRRYEPGDPCWEQVVVHEIDVDADQAARIVAVDNRSAELGAFDTDLLTDLLTSLPDLDGTGYTHNELDDMLAAIASASVGPPDPPDTVITDPHEPLEQKLAGYSGNDSRTVILTYTAEVYPWVVDKLTELGAHYGTDTTSATVHRLLTEAAA